MQMVKKILILLFVVWIALLWIMPKQELYYKLEKVLEEKDIKINEARIEEGVFSLTLHQADIYVKGIKLATVEKVNLFTLLFYSKVGFDNLVLDETLKSMAPTNIEEAMISHIVLVPKRLNLDMAGSFWNAKGKASLAQKHLRVDFNSTQGIEAFKPKLQQDDKGWYYEASF